MQSPFSNVSIMDKEFLKSLFEDKLYPDFTKINLNSTYELGKWFFEYFSKINMNEGIFTFPVITLACSVIDGKYGDTDFINWICETNNKKAIGNIYTGEPTSLSSCCRLRSEITKPEYQNSFGVGGVSIGSHRVCGLNLPRLWKDSYNGTFDKSKFTKKLFERMNFIKKILDAHKKIIQYHIDVGVLPLYTYNWMNLNKQYSTIGIIGVYELQQYYNDFFDKENKVANISNYDFSIDILSQINSISEEWNKNGNYNIEQIPGESIAVRLAEIDKLLEKNEYYEMYSNQYIPLIQNNISIADRFKIQGKFDTKTSGGSILHINIVEIEQITSEQFHKLFDIALKTKTVYWAVNYVYIQCENNHYFIGNNSTEKCPVCESNKLNYFSRVVGFITNVNNWIEKRRDWEFPNRKFYKM
jgi:ribonucleoside-triphosphate reductase